MLSVLCVVMGCMWVGGSLAHKLEHVIAKIWPLLLTLAFGFFFVGRDVVTLEYGATKIHIELIWSH